MRKIYLLVLIVSFLHGFCVMADTLDIRDDSGQLFHFAGPVQRIVSLAPHITELVFISGAGAQVVGTVEYSHFPEQARKVPLIGNSQSFDLERILKLKPDVILAWTGGNAEADLEQLNKSGIPVIKTDVKILNDIPRLIRLFSRLGGQQQGFAEADKFNRQLKQLTKENEHKPRVSVFYQIWNQPLMTLSSHQYISDVIRRCGGRNILAESALIAPTIDREYVLAKNPQVIITAGSQAWLDEWKRWKQIDAVRFNQLYRLNPDDIARPVPAILKGMKQICEFLDQARKAD